MLRAFVVVVLASAIAHAEPERVLVVDPDAELVHAIEWTLQPWRMVVVAETNSVVDPALVSARATEANAQFIVWRDGDELVVFDRKREVTERRPASTGAMDPVSAASAALTVKTMMRLPDPAPEETAPGPTTGIVVGPTVVDESDVLRIGASIGVDTQPALRATFGAMYRPTPYALRVGAAFELAGQDIDRVGFKGRARDYGLLAVASWVVPVNRFELEPWIAAGVMADIVDGKHGQEMRHETAWVPTARAGLAMWWWHADHWGFGMTASANFALGTPTYTRDPDKPNMAVFYDMPAFAGAIALVAGWRR